jgi:hypothetical protein
LGVAAEVFWLERRLENRAVPRERVRLRAEGAEQGREDLVGPFLVHPDVVHFSARLVAGAGGRFGFHDLCRRAYRPRIGAARPGGRWPPGL